MRLLHHRSIILLAVIWLHVQQALATSTHPRESKKKCRTQPGDLDFPRTEDWASLNSTVEGRLLVVVPSAAYCSKANCTDDQWSNTMSRSQIPGQMIAYNWEQDYESVPPSLCLRNGTECNQGNVPVYAINSTQPSHIQAGVRFASKHNLKVAIKSSGHDLLGRSTAKGSLLLWTHYMRNISFDDSFFVQDKNLGSAVTVGSGVPLNGLYSKSGEHGKFIVGANAATVAAAGGHIQGGGHSAFSPVLGLAVDNVLQFEVVLADGSFVTANEKMHSDLFWALRGGGAGSWGVITSATFQTFPTFNASLHIAVIVVPTNADAGTLARVHARHVFDWDQYRAGHYLFAFNSSLVPILGEGVAGNVFTLLSYFKDVDAVQVNASMKPFLDEVKEVGQGRWLVLANDVTTATANELMVSSNDSGGTMTILGSRLMPGKVYQQDVENIGRVYEEFLDEGVAEVGAIVLGGGKVSENSNLHVSLNPKWRSAKTLLFVSAIWNESTTPSKVEEIKQKLTNQWVPKLAALTKEPDSGTYSNEADVREPNFQQTFFGPNYARLKEVKTKYDPGSLFIVAAGVGSEEWDELGICRQ